MHAVHRPRRLDEIPFIAPEVAAAGRLWTASGSRHGARVPGRTPSDMLCVTADVRPAELGRCSEHISAINRRTNGWPIVGSAKDGDHGRCHRITAAWLSSGAIAKPADLQTSTRCAARRVLRSRPARATGKSATLPRIVRERSGAGVSLIRPPPPSATRNIAPGAARACANSSWAAKRVPRHHNVLRRRSAQPTTRRDVDRRLRKSAREVQDAARSASHCSAGRCPRTARRRHREPGRASTDAAVTSPSRYCCDGWMDSCRDDVAGGAGHPVIRCPAATAPAALRETTA